MPGQPVPYYPSQPVQPQRLPNQNVPRTQPNASSQVTLPPVQSRNPTVARGQVPEPDAVPNRLETLKMPTAEVLGIQRTRPIEVDWNNVRRRLDRLSITSFNLSKLPDGGFRFVCVVPSLDRPQRVESEALTECDAI